MTELLVTLLQAATSTQSISLGRHFVLSASMSQFEVALAMCRHFAPGSSMEETSKKATYHKQEETKRESSSSLFEVCERHMEELVVAKFLVGWCCARGVGGVANKDGKRALVALALLAAAVAVVCLE